MSTKTLTDSVIKSDVQMTILNWDLEKIKKRMTREGYVLRDLDELEREYKRYLILVTTHSTKLPISSVVDEMWHTHILFTRDYVSLGDAIGGFIHHEPVTSEVREASLQQAYVETLSLYEKHWGTPDPQFWPPQDAVCDPEGEGNDDTGGQW